MSKSLPAAAFAVGVTCLVLTGCSPSRKDVAVANPCPDTVNVRVWNATVPRPGEERINATDIAVPALAMRVAKEAVMVFDEERDFWAAEIISSGGGAPTVLHISSSRQLVIPAEVCSS